MTGMLGPVEALMIEGHAAADAHLRRAVARGGPGDQGGEQGIDEVAFAAFRRAMLAHMTLEEDVLLAYVEERLELPFAARIRDDHARIRSLMHGAPTASKVSELLLVLGHHNDLEEGPAGLYATCDALAGDEASALVERLRNYARKPLAGVAR